MSESVKGGSHATPASGRPAPPVDVVDVEDEGVDETSTVAELRVVAQKHDIANYVDLRKPELLARIRKVLGLS